MHVANTLDRPAISEDEARQRRYDRALRGIIQAQERARATDIAWGEELRRTFGRRAGDVRYTPEGKGIPGSRLRELYDEREAARVIHDRASRLYRNAMLPAGAADRIGALVTDECRCARCRA